MILQFSVPVSSGNTFKCNLQTSITLDMLSYHVKIFRTISAIFHSLYSSLEALEAVIRRYLLHHNEARYDYTGQTEIKNNLKEIVLQNAIGALIVEAKRY